MCVIAVKPKGVDMIDDQIIKDMWDTNSDGAGFMYVNKDGDVIINKGHMVYEDFLKNVKNIEDVDDIKETPLIMHFRITTHGGTSPENTHPFPVSSQIEHLKALDVKAHLAMAHNGVISSVDTDPNLSDTQIFIKDIIAPLSRFKESFLQDYAKLIKDGIGQSKLVFLDNKGTITKFAKWEEKDGIYYSNLNHDTTTYFKGVSYRYGYGYGYDYDYDYDYGYSYKGSAKNKSKSTYLTGESRHYKHGNFYIVDTKYPHTLKSNFPDVKNGDVFLFVKYSIYECMVDALTGLEIDGGIIASLHTRLIRDDELEKLSDVIHDTLTDYIPKSAKPKSIACEPNKRFGRLIFADSIGERFKIVKKRLRVKKVKNDVSFFGAAFGSNDGSSQVYKEFKTVDDKFYYDEVTGKGYYRESNKAFVEIKEFAFFDDVESASFKGFQGTRTFKNALLTVSV